MARKQPLEGESVSPERADEFIKRRAEEDEQQRRAQREQASARVEAARAVPNLQSPMSKAPEGPRSFRGVSGDSRNMKRPADPTKKKKRKGKKLFWQRKSKTMSNTRSPWARKLKLTREGKYFLGITLGVGFAAINTGNNLLYLMLGMMLSLIIVSGVMSELSLRTLNVKRRLPIRAQVGRSHLVEIEVFNNKQRIPSYAIEVEDLRAGQPADKRCFFLKISPRSTQIAAYRRTPQRRGLERHTGFRIATRFPFGLFEKSREVHSTDELIIYPAVDSVRLPRHRQGDNIGEGGPLGRGPGEEIYALRPMRDGDDSRDIYWRKSTIPGQMVLRERAHEMRHKVSLRINTTTDQRPDDDGELAINEDFERRIRQLASFAIAHIRRGDWVTITTDSGDRVISDKARGIDPALRFLALLKQTLKLDEEHSAQGAAQQKGGSGSRKADKGRAA